MWGETKKLPDIADIGAEQALLGTLLYDPDAIHRLPPEFGAHHFCEPFHQRLFMRMRLMANSGRAFDPVILGVAFNGDPAFRDLGGHAYFGDLVDRAPPSANAVGYAGALTEIHVRRTLSKLGAELTQAARDPEVTGDDLLGEVERTTGELRAGNAEMRLMDAGEAVDRVFGTLDSTDEAQAGISTALGPLDERIGRWFPGDLIVMGGRPSMGKSALANTIAQNVALTMMATGESAGLGVIEFNVEMTEEAMMRRHLTSVAYSLQSSTAPNYSAIRRRALEYEQRRILEVAGGLIRQAPLKLLKRSVITIAQILSLARRQAAIWAGQGIRLALITIDHAGRVRSDQYGKVSRYEEQTLISASLKGLADELKIPVLALVQLSRALEQRDDKRPLINDLRDTGAYEEDADVVIGVYRDAYYAQREKEPDDKTTKGQLAWADWDARKKSRWIEAILLKVREGSPGTAKLWGDMGTNTILGHEPSLFGGDL